MDKLLKYTTVLILAVLAGFLYLMNEECFFTKQKKIALFNSYLKRASDPNEKQLRLVGSNKTNRHGMQGKLTVTTLRFADEKYYLNAFSKTYILMLIRQANIENSDLDLISAGLYLVVDYAVRKEHETIFIMSTVGKNDTQWNVLNSLFDNPVHRVKKKITNISYHSHLLNRYTSHDLRQSRRLDHV